jgi:hypothetical protein
MMGIESATSAAAPLFHFVMIKPTHYDDDGYPIQWLRSAIPSNTLACLNGLAEDARARQVLGEGVEIRLHTYDETNRRVRPDKIIRMVRQQGGRVLIGLVGVQSNQFDRAVDLAQPFLAAGFPVSIGGFHVSGCTAMLPEMPKERRDAQAMGISFFCDLQLHGRSTLTRGRAGADLAGATREPYFGLALEHRSRARLPLPVLVLHHH